MVGANVGCQCLVGFIDIYCLSLVQLSLDSDPKLPPGPRGRGQCDGIFCIVRDIALASIMHHLAPPPAHLDTLLRACLRGRLEANLRPVDGLHFLYDGLPVI